MTGILKDFRYSLRSLSRSPIFLAVAVFSLALGIGANTAIFTLINQLILQPLPVRNPEQLVMLAGRGNHYGGNNGRDKLSYPMYQEIRDKNQVFSGMFCTYPNTVSATFQGPNGTDRRRFRLRQLLPGAGHRRGGGPRVHGSGRSDSGRPSAGGAELRILACAVRRRSGTFWGRRSW